MSLSSKSPAFDLLQRAITLVTLLAAEVVANTLMHEVRHDEKYFWAGIVTATAIFCMMLWMKSQAGRDILDICIFDVLVQIFGLTSYMNAWSMGIYYGLAQSVLILKVVRLSWGLHWPHEKLNANWPPFGPLGIFFSIRREEKHSSLTVGDKTLIYLAIGLCFVAPMAFKPLFGAITLSKLTIALLAFILVFVPKLTRRLKLNEADRIAAQNALAQKSIELAQTNVELATKNTELAQLALKMQEKNDELDALCISRDETAKKLQDRNNVLREGNHDILPLTLWLTMNVQQALERASTDEQRAPLAEVVAVSKEVTAAISDIIKKAQIEFAWFAPPMHAVSTEILQHRLRQRLEPLAALRKIRLYGSNQQAVLHSNELVLMRILGNLIHNAITHCPPGSEVQLRFYPGENDCHIVVADNGRGIPDCAGRDRGANFVSLLQQARQHYRDSQDGIIRLNGDGIDDGAGYGIGLGSVTRLCDDIGTNMTLCSRPGVGSVFRFRVQLAQP